MDLHELELDLQQREGKKRELKEAKADSKDDTAVVEMIVEGVDEEFVDEGLEENLIDALSLLQDCNHLLIAIGNPLLHQRITYYMQQEIIRVSAETTMFLEGYATELPDSPTVPTVKEIEGEVLDAEYYNIYD